MYIGNDLQVAESGNKIIDDISSSFNGSTTSFALTVGGYAPVPFPINTQQIYVSVNGVIQEPDPSGSAGFKLSGNNIVFSSAPANGHAFFGVILSGADYVTVGTEFPAGSATSPSITFGTDNDTGLYSVTSGQMGFTSNGVQIFTLDSDGFRFNDNKKLIIGSGSDLEIYHDGTDSRIKNTTGNLIIADTNGIVAIQGKQGEESITCAADGAVTLYYDNGIKLATTSGGINVTGTVTDDGATHDGDVTFTGAASNVIWDKSDNALEFTDNSKAVFGTGSDLQIYHDGTNAYIKSEITGHFNIDAQYDVYIRKQDGSETRAAFKADSACELFHDNTKRLETTSAGAQITGNAIATSKFRGNDGVKISLGDSEDLQIWHDANTHSYITESGGGGLAIGGSQISLMNVATTEYMVKGVADGGVELYYDNKKRLATTNGGTALYGDEGGNCELFFNADEGDDNSDIWKFVAFESPASTFDLYNYASGGYEKSISCVGNGGVELYYDGTKKFETTSYGVGFTENVRLNTDNNSLQIGAGQDLKLYHDGTHSRIKNETGALLLENTGECQINKGTSEYLARFIPDGAVELYYDNSKKLETTDYGVLIKRLSGGSTVLQIEGCEGNHATINMFADDGDNDNDKWQLDAQTGNSFILYNYADGAWEKSFLATGGGAFNIYHNNTKVFETFATGFQNHSNSGNIQMKVGSSAADDCYITDGSLNYDSSSANHTSGWISHYGHANAFTQFRTTYIGNGKGTAILTCNGSSSVVSGDLSDTSDERLKKDIVSIGSEGLTTIKQLRPVSFKWRNTDKNSYGFIAQELEKILPHAVATAETDDKAWTKIQAAAADTGAVAVRDTKSINTNSIVAYLTKAVQELSAKNDALETRIATLESA